MKIINANTVLHALGAALVFFAVTVSCGPQRTLRADSAPPSSLQDMTPYVSRTSTSPADNVVLNGSFEERDAQGMPNAWLVYPAGAVLADASTDFDVFDGKYAVTLKTVDGEYAALNQYLKLPPEAEGKTLMVTAQAKTPYDRFVILSVECKAGGVSRTIAEKKWPASPDNWTPVTVEAAIPVGADPGTLRVRIVCANKGGYFVRVDDVRATVTR